MRAAAVVIATLASGCAAAFGTVGPGGAGVGRVHGPSVSVRPVGGGYGVAEYNPARAYEDRGPRWGFAFGFKLGGTLGEFAAREPLLGIGSEPHADLTYVAASDRWAARATLGWVFRSLVDEDDVVTFSGVAPSAAVSYSLHRRLYVHAGAGVTVGALGVRPEASGDGPSADAREARLLGGLTFLFRRTPNIDMVFRVEGSAYRSTEVVLGGEAGRLQGIGVTVEMILSGF